MRWWILLGAIVVGALGGTVAAHAADLSLRLVGVEVDNQPLLIAAYTSDETFREEPEAAATAKLPASAASLEITLTDLPAGPVAVMVWHDQDADGEQDRFLGMIPTEGYGLTNNPDLSGPPEFGECAVTLPETGGEATIEMKY